MDELVSKAAVLRIIFDSTGKPATEIYQKVREPPPADAVEVVRCRECEYWETNWVPNHYDIGEVHFCSIADKMTMGHYFCFDGERKRGGQEDG